ncbi:MAG TPA: hypothetical protein VLW53_15025 [Candidatus Eisenbacteria bacterium]|nr:hypothetical protein [Candidatus Eisenbacteria bacterium]
MAAHALGRRELLTGAGVAAGGVALAGLGATPAVASTGDDHGDLTGSWLIVHQDDPPGDPTKVQAVVSFAAGGVLISHDIHPAGPPITGTWARRSHSGFAGTMWTGFAGEGPNSGPGPTLRIRIRGRRDHDRISGTFRLAVFDPASGQQVESGTGTFSGSRITAGARAAGRCGSSRPPGAKGARRAPRRAGA